MSFEIGQPRTTFAQWNQSSLENFCWCLSQSLNPHIAEDNQLWQQQKWLLPKTLEIEIDSFKKQILSSYCFCASGCGGNEQSNQSMGTNMVLNEEYNLSALSGSDKHEEVKTVLESRHQTQEVIEESDTARYNPNNNVSESEEVLGMTGGDLSYKTRKDIVYKATFRRMRKYFIQDFLSTTELRSQHRDYLVCLIEYCAVNFPQCDINRACVIFDCIINAKNKLGAISQEDTQLKPRIERLMYCYSQKLFRTMSAHPVFLKIMLHFLGIEGVSSLIFSEPKVSFHPKVQTHLLNLRLTAAWMKESPSV
ncbi:unnamed protein product [Moneuplotes crassus]|uniref:Uncharacterized protein n=1 Tax=Euplotes crassus TaxID=5936 RepID=A0AAD2CVC4_EUPCR|nr:unnamed protein product [Moneuplotes crassus]